MNIKKLVNKKYIYLSFILLISFIVYVRSAIDAGLWYDEAVEYYYSKFMTGAVPGGRSTGNMYERIVSTYQPPLYNFLMYFWLKIFDTEFGFRLAGIVATIVGAIGVFKAIDEQTENYKVASAGSLLYVFSSSVVYYGLECAEYNLMLCFAAYTTYYFVRVLKRMDFQSVIGFFIFASLSVYSQYGAAFIIASMFIFLFIEILIENIKSQDFTLCKNTVLASLVTLVAAVIPLFVLFLMPQMNRQGSISVSHSPVFKKGLIKDYVDGIYRCLQWYFTSHGINEITGIVTKVVLLLCVIAIVFAVKNKTLRKFIYVLIVTYTLYFIAVAVSVYAYNNWNKDSLGCNNLGGKYALFFVPVVVVMLTIGFNELLIFIKSTNFTKRFYVPFVVFSCLILAGFCIAEIKKLESDPWQKYDMRELVKTYYEKADLNLPVLTHNRSDAMFNYYVSHNENYIDINIKNVNSMESKTSSADYEVIKAWLTNQNYLEMNEFYYISPVADNNITPKTFIEVISDAGFKQEPVYDGLCTLVHLKK